MWILRRWGRISSTWLSGALAVPPDWTGPGRPLLGVPTRRGRPGPVAGSPAAPAILASASVSTIAGGAETVVGEPQGGELCELDAGLSVGPRHGPSRAEWFKTLQAALLAPPQLHRLPAGVQVLDPHHRSVLDPAGDHPARRAGCFALATAQSRRARKGRCGDCPGHAVERRQRIHDR